MLDSVIAILQWLARQIATREVQGSNPGKGDNLLYLFEYFDDVK